MFNWLDALGLIGLFSICVFLTVMGLLSRRLGYVTHARAYYMLFFLAAGLVGVGIVTRFIHFTSELALIEDLNNNIGWVLLYNGAPAVGMTLGLVAAWRYWSWLLAERD